MNDKYHPKNMGITISDTILSDGSRVRSDARGSAPDRKAEAFERGAQASCALEDKTEHLILSCAPVFMGVKPAAFVRLYPEELGILQRLAACCPLKIQPVDVFPKNQAVIYIPQLLEDAFRQPGALFLLRSIGYGGRHVEDYVREVVRRLQGAYRNKNLFPHEIGIFLGYPLEDVLGFWLFGGRDPKAEGEWKIYSDVERAKRIQYFHKAAVDAVKTAAAAGASLESIAGYFWNGP